MTIRTIASTVIFEFPFTLKGIPEEQPPGAYEVETDEEIIEGNDRTVYRRAATLFHLKRGGTTRTYRVDPLEIEAALSRDASAGRGPGAEEQDAGEADTPH